VQESSGVWLHRHYSTGEFAPSWGLVQIDETGAILWGIHEHYSFTESRDFLSGIWESIERGAAYLCGSIDGETGLPMPSVELWEENTCESVYSAASVAGGLEAAAKCADLLAHNANSQEWNRVADRIRRAIPEKLWNKKRKAFSRSIKRVVSEETFAKHLRDKSSGFYIDAPENSLYPIFYQAEDTTIDSSLLGLVFPFHVLDARDDKMRRSALAARKHLWWKKTGGLFRYEGDVYVGGNPWILTTLWLAIYHIEAGEPSRAVELIKWAADHATESGLLTEQVDKKTGKPLWAIPLGWSHAMFVIASLMLTNRK
ncbi:MAG: glycoside hydrolase family 15 protein, partial [Blastocatellia bacterium]